MSVIEILNEAQYMEPSDGGYYGELNTNFGLVTVEVYDDGNDEWVMAVSIESSNNANEYYVSEYYYDEKSALDHAEDFMSVIVANDAVTYQDILGAVNSFNLIPYDGE